MSIDIKKRHSSDKFLFHVVWTFYKSTENDYALTRKFRPRIVTFFQYNLILLRK